VSQSNFARTERDGARQGRNIFQQKNIFDREIICDEGADFVTNPSLTPN
jgi:hypothetical protein